jgi:iron complex outermembrane recepter protein
MKYRNPRFAVRAGLLPAGIALALAPAFAGAQEQAESNPTTLDRIEVTGSRIRQVDTETAQPVLSITRAEIEKQGFRSVADILQNISAAGSPAISRAQPLSSGEMVGGYYIDLRNLGTERTLVLVNGKRLGASVSGYQDVSQIPTVMVERIEVLKDGASSIYGSDAMAGVINIITRSDFEGAEASVYYGQYSQGDGQKDAADFIMGFTGDRGSLTVGVEYSKEDGVWAKDRWFSESSRGSRRPTVGWTTVSQWGTLQTGGRNYVLDRGADPYDFANFHLQDGTPITGDVSNSNQQMHLLTPTERRSVFANGKFDISDKVRFNTDILYTRREAQAQVAGYPLQSSAYDLMMSADSFYNPLGNQYNPGAGVDVGFVHRGWEVPRLSTNQLTTYRFTGAFEGSFEIGDKYFDWDVGYLYNNAENMQRQTGNFSIPAVRAATGESFYNANTGRVECGSAAGLAAGTNPAYGPGPGGCVPWNPFIAAGRSGDGGITGNDALRQFLFPTTHNTGEVESTNYFANLTGALATLPAGDLGFAVGYEYRKEEGSFEPDALSQSGNSTDLASGPTGGSYDVNEVYAELNVPILADLPGAKELSVSLASRYSDYSTFGDTVNNKFGFKWKPLDSLMVRGTWAEGFRAPTIADLYGGSSQSFEYFTDPCDTVFGDAATNPATLARCAQDIANAATFRQLKQGFVVADGPDEQSPVPFTSGSNPDLTPETSTSKTLGVVWSPSFVEGLNVALDWWAVKVDNTIVPDTPTDQLNDCYILGVAERCNSFTRDATLGIVSNLSYGGRNAGFLDTEGYDLEATYRWETGNFGRFDFNWQTTYVSKYEQKSTNDPNQPVNIENGFGSYFRVRSNLSTNWTMGNFGIGWNMRYFSGTKERCYLDAGYPVRCTDMDYQSGDPTKNYPMNRMGANTFHDLQVRWTAPWNATISVGANNVFDHYAAPAYSAPNSQFSYYGGFDIGRFIYMQYKQSF